jgi:hypothetical protein
MKILQLVLKSFDAEQRGEIGKIDRDIKQPFKQRKMLSRS